MNPIAQLFLNLDRWHKLPNYQLERRADVLFSLYLPKIVGEFVKRPVSAHMVPELPILCSLIWPERAGRSSVKADYLLLAEDRTEAYLLELKTDVSSRNDRQDHYLCEAASKGLGCVLEGLVLIAKASKQREKYASLFALLGDMGLVELPAGEPVRSTWFGAIKVLACPEKVTTLYVQPRKSADATNVIDFEAVARHVEQYDDKFSTQFAVHLRRWSASAQA